MNPDYVEEVGYVAQLKQELATIAGFGNHNLKDYSVEQLVKEVERQEKDMVYSYDYGYIMHPTVQDAYLYINFGFKTIQHGETV